MDLLGEYDVSIAFNMADLSAYYAENEEVPSLRANSFQEEGDDRDQGTKSITKPEETINVCPRVQEVKGHGYGQGTPPTFKLLQFQFSQVLASLYKHDHR